MKVALCTSSGFSLNRPHILVTVHCECLCIQSWGNGHPIHLLESPIFSAPLLRCGHCPKILWLVVLFTLQTLALHFSQFLSFPSFSRRLLGVVYSTAFGQPLIDFYVSFHVVNIPVFLPTITVQTVVMSFMLPERRPNCRPNIDHIEQLKHKQCRCRPQEWHFFYYDWVGCSAQ